MPRQRQMTIVSSRENGIVVNRVTGPVDASQVLAFINANIKGWGTAPVIWDVSEAQLGDLSLPDCSGLVSSTVEDAQFRAGRRAALVSRQALHSSLLELISSMARQRGHPVALKAFDSYERAKAWVDGAD